MKPLSLDEIKDLEMFPHSFKKEELFDELIHTARLAHKMREALEYIAEDRLSL